MKKIIYSIIITLAAFSTMSCEPFLTVEPEDSLPAGKYYANAKAIRANTAVLYSSMPWFEYHKGFMYYGGDMLAGDMYYTYDQEGHYYYNSVTSTNSHLRSGWLGLYRVVSFCNSLINDMPAIAGENGVEQKVIDAALAEAYTVRAMAYYIITEFWGEAPIVDNATALITSSDPGAIFVNRHTQESLYKFIIRDLKRAAENLPHKDDPGRATKTTALALMAKVQLTYAAYKNDAALYDEAKTTAAQAIEEGEANGFGLLESGYEDLFKVEHNNNCESLFAIQCITGGYTEGNARNANFGRSARLGDQAWGGGKGPTLSLQNLYSSDDQRRKGVFMTNGDKYDYLAVEEGGYEYKYVYRDPNNLSTVVEDANEVLANIKKYVIGKPADCGGQIGLNQDGGNNLYLLRFADLLFVYVEACIGTGDATADPTAISYVGRILNRAGVENTYSSITYQDLLRERRKEFAFEGINWYDVKRYWYRDKAAAVAYLNDMKRDMVYKFNWSSDLFTYDSMGEATFGDKELNEWQNDKRNYVTIWAQMDITGENPDGSLNRDYYAGADALEASGHRIPIVFTDASMVLPIPEVEATSAPILKEPAVEYEFSE